MNMDTGTPAKLRGMIIDIAILIAVSTVSVSCGTFSKKVLSQPPVALAIDSEPIALGYAREFGQMKQKYYWSPVSPDKRWELFIQRENKNAILSEGGFFSLRLRDTASGDSCVLFTLWDADVDSGVRARVRWSGDGKALQIEGDTRGFSYEPRPDAMKYESFNLLYLVQEDKVFSIPSSSAT